MKVGIIEYGLGNIYSLYSIFNKLNIEYFLSAKKESLEQADVLLLPGVGAFGEAMRKLNELELVDYIKETEKPLLGICLGMQLLFETGNEGGIAISGLNLVKGSVNLLKQKKLPNVGFMEIAHSNLDIDISQKDYYFIHSYSASRCDVDAKYAIAELGDNKITAAVQKNNVFGFQFHPELSQNNGIFLFEQIKKWHLKE